MMPFGTVVHYATPTDISVLDTTLQGADVTWDFTALQNADATNDKTTTIASPASTPYASTYPTSNYVEVERTDSSGTEKGLVYNYFKLTDTTLERLGAQSVYTGSSSIYSDTQVEYFFPTTYGTTHNDTWASSASSFGGTYNLECVGYGTLKLPSGTYNNVLLVRVKMTELLTYKLYFWYAENGAVLACYENMSFMGSFGFYANGTPTGIKETAVADVHFTNPVQNTLNVKIDKINAPELNYTLSNINGQSIQTGKTANEGTLSLDVSSLPQGVYIFTVNADNFKSKTYKVIKK